MSNENLGFLIGLPPKKAVEYFKSKGYTFSWNWYDTWQEAHLKAFTVAKVAQMDVLMDIRKMVQESIDKGLTFRQFQKELEPELKKKGWWGKQTIDDKEVQLGSPYRLRTIYNENLSTSHAAGRYKAMINNVDNRPFWQYWTMDDNRVRPAHARLHGKVFPASDPFWDTFYPPNDWGDRCSVRALSERDLKRRGLIPETSEGTLSTEEKSVSKNSDIKRPVSVYTDPVTGEKTATGPGWSYNPGKTSWEPDLSKYPEDLVRQYKKETLNAELENMPDEKGSSSKNNTEKYLKDATGYTETVRQVIKDTFKKDFTGDVRFAKTEEEERELFKDMSPDVPGYYNIKGDYIAFRQIVAKNISEQSDNSAIYQCMVLHESGHAIDKGVSVWSKFTEESSTELISERLTVNSIDGVNAERFLRKDCSYHPQRISALLQLIPVYKNPDALYEKLISLKQLDTTEEKSRELRRDFEKDLIVRSGITSQSKFEKLLKNIIDNQDLRNIPDNDTIIKEIENHFAKKTYDKQILHARLLLSNIDKEVKEIIQKGLSEKEAAEWGEEQKRVYREFINSLKEKKNKDEIDEKNNRIIEIQAMRWWLRI
jgi:SPP1 gp7 family putative phage head morphogenesis protein